MERMAITEERVNEKGQIRARSAGKVAVITATATSVKKEAARKTKAKKEKVLSPNASLSKGRYPSCHSTSEATHGTKVKKRTSWAKK